MRGWSAGVGLTDALSLVFPLRLMYRPGCAVGIRQASSCVGRDVFIGHVPFAHNSDVALLQAGRFMNSLVEVSRGIRIRVEFRPDYSHLLIFWAG